MLAYLHEVFLGVAEEGGQVAGPTGTPGLQVMHGHLADVAPEMLRNPARNLAVHIGRQIGVGVILLDESDENTLRPLCPSKAVCNGQRALRIPVTSSVGTSLAIKRASERGGYLTLQSTRR